MRKLVYISTFLIVILSSCSEEQTSCNYNKVIVLDETTSMGDSKHSYDIEFSDFDGRCVTKNSIENFISFLYESKLVEKPIRSLRCFRNNGGGIYNELSSPQGSNELIFLLVENINSEGDFEYEIID